MSLVTADDLLSVMSPREMAAELVALRAEAVALRARVREMEAAISSSADSPTSREYGGHGFGVPPPSRTGHGYSHD